MSSSLYDRPLGQNYLQTTALTTVLAGGFYAIQLYALLLLRIRGKANASDNVVAVAMFLTVGFTQIACQQLAENDATHQRVRPTELPNKRPKETC